MTFNPTPNHDLTFFENKMIDIYFDRQLFWSTTIFIDNYFHRMNLNICGEFEMFWELSSTHYPHKQTHNMAWIAEESDKRNTNTCFGNIIFQVYIRNLS